LIFHGSIVIVIIAYMLYASWVDYRDLLSFIILSYIYIYIYGMGFFYLYTTHPLATFNMNCNWSYCCNAWYSMTPVKNVSGTTITLLL